MHCATEAPCISGKGARHAHARARDSLRACARPFAVGRTFPSLTPRAGCLQCRGCRYFTCVAVHCRMGRRSRRRRDSSVPLSVAKGERRLFNRLLHCRDVRVVRHCRPHGYDHRRPTAVIGYHVRDSHSQNQCRIVEDKKEGKTR